MELLIGLCVIIITGYYIIKGYNSAGVLLSTGLLLLLLSVALNKPILPQQVKSTGLAYLDILEYVKYLLLNRGGDLGMLIMVLCGFAKYMSHIGANDVVVKLISRPLHKIKSPYILMMFAYVVACCMTFSVSSATGLGVLLMATLFPIMVNIGISRGAAAAICASPSSIILSPTSGDVVLAAEKAQLPLLDFAIKLTLPTSIVAITAVAISHYFWQRYLDRKADIQVETLEVAEITTKVPNYYAILPFLPVIGVLIFSGQYAPSLHIITIILIGMLITCLLEFIRTFDAKTVLNDLTAFYHGMADAFSGVVILLVAAGVFAQGLSTIGFIHELIDSVQNFSSGGMLMMIALALITALAAITTGSGNAPFYAFVELIPRLASQMGINAAYLTIPMLQASNIGRAMSPVSGVVVAVSGMANISPFEVVKRTSVPMAVGLVVVMITTHWIVPQ
ncbi:anaerobic C4-dicarboxylate transporter DcuC [Lonepinella koalarum]|uniref:anaerobic C4-dicarboxylate transporter DcuC n=1 Tax=Lonepinella koalarum TaxID=53417 RepID=UPI003F6E1BC9